MFVVQEIIARLTVGLPKFSSVQFRASKPESQPEPEPELNLHELVLQVQFRFRTSSEPELQIQIFIIKMIFFYHIHIIYSAFVVQAFPSHVKASLPAPKSPLL